MSTRFNTDGLNTTQHRTQKIIVSLTSYPSRINIVPYVIASLLKQTMKPDKILLWLAEPQFPGRKLPQIFDRLRSCGVEVRFCPEDLGPHKKYFYSMQEHPGDIIITFDDDFIYENNIIETLYASYLKHPSCVSAMRVNRINFDSDGNIAPYLNWEQAYPGVEGQESHIWHAIGVGGVLYPPNCLHPEVFNIEAIKRLCPRADDIWLKFMEVMNGTKIVPASNDGRVHGIQVFGSQKFALYKSNNINGGNDIQIKAVLEEYNILSDGRRVLDILREEQH